MLRWASRHQPGARLPAGERIYAIGDVHGEGRLLLNLLVKIDQDNRVREQAKTTLVLLGDIIDRGDQAAELIRTLSYTEDPRLVILKGNHEQLMVEAYQGDADALDLWLRIGGRTTLQGFGISNNCLDSTEDFELIDLLKNTIDMKIIDWMNQLPTSWTAGDYFFAHAGIRPGIPLDQQNERDLMWIRQQFLKSNADHGKVIVHGHSIDPGLPRLGGNRIGLDTGAHEHRRLTALGLEDDQQWLLREWEPAVKDEDATPPLHPIYIGGWFEQLYRTLLMGSNARSASS